MACAEAGEGTPSWAAQLMSLQVTDSVVGATQAADALLKAAALDPSNKIPDEGEDSQLESSPPTPIENMLTTAFQEKKLPVEANSEFNRWWAKELARNPKLKAEYKLVGRAYDACRKFKIDWAGKRSHEMAQQRTRTSEFRQVDGFKGQYLPLSVHVREEGGDAMAFVAVQTYVKNIAMFLAQGKTYKGRPWFVYDKLYGRVKFLRIDEYFEDSNAEAWGHTRNLRDEESATHTSAPSERQAARNPTPPAGPNETPPAAKHEAPPAGEEGTHSVPEAKKRKTAKAKGQAAPPDVEAPPYCSRELEDSHCGGDEGQAEAGEGQHNSVGPPPGHHFASGMELGQQRRQPEGCDREAARSRQEEDEGQVLVRVDRAVSVVQECHEVVLRADHRIELAGRPPSDADSNR